MQPDRIGRLPEVQALTGLSRSTIYARIEDGLLVAPVPLGGQAVGFPIAEIVAINQARIAGKTDDQVRALVIELESARTGTPATPRRKRNATLAAAA